MSDSVCIQAPDEFAALIDSVKELRDAHRRVLLANDLHRRSQTERAQAELTCRLEDRRLAMVTVVRAYDQAEECGALTPRIVTKPKKRKPRGAYRRRVK